MSFATSGKFSAEEMTLAMLPISFLDKSSRETFSLSPRAKSDIETKSLIIPCKPSARPSSGE